MSGRAAAAPLGLRLAHAVVFLGLAGLAVRGALPEVEQLQRQLTRDFLVGEGVRVGLLGAGIAAGIAGLALVWALLRGRSASGAFSVVIGLALAWSALAQRSPVVRPPASSVNLELLQAGRAVQHRMGQRLVREGEAPPVAEFERALAETRAPSSVVIRTPTGERLPIRIVQIAEQVDQPAPVPGTVWLWRSPDGAAFALRPVGVTPGGDAWPLRDETGAALWLEAVHQPDGALLPAEALP